MGTSPPNREMRYRCIIYYARQTVSLYLLDGVYYIVLEIVYIVFITHKIIMRTTCVCILIAAV